MEMGFYQQVLSDKSPTLAWLLLQLIMAPEIQSFRRHLKEFKLDTSIV